MTNETTTPRRKTEQAIKLSASWTPNDDIAHGISEGSWGLKSPLRVRGGRISVAAAISMGDGKPASVIRAYERVEELRRELEATGTVHGFTSGPGAVPAGEAERLPEEAADA